MKTNKKIALSSLLMVAVMGLTPLLSASVNTRENHEDDQNQQQNEQRHSEVEHEDSNNESQDSQ